VQLWVFAEKGLHFALAPSERCEMAPVVRELSAEARHLDVGVTTRSVTLEGPLTPAIMTPVNPPLPQNQPPSRALKTTLQVEVRADGIPESASVLASSGSNTADDRAMRQALKEKFLPPLLDRVPVAGHVVYTVRHVDEPPRLR
jgi:TonB family protein